MNNALKEKIVVSASYILLAVAAAAGLYIWGSNTIPTIKLVTREHIQQYKNGKANLPETTLSIAAYSVLIGIVGVFTDVENIHKDIKAMKAVDTSDICSERK